MCSAGLPAVQATTARGGAAGLSRLRISSALTPIQSSIQQKALRWLSTKRSFIPCTASCSACAARTPQPRSIAPAQIHAGTGLRKSAPAQMWPGPGADVARSRRRCGPVPAQTWRQSRRRCGAHPGACVSRVDRRAQTPHLGLDSPVVDARAHVLVPVTRPSRTGQRDTTPTRPTRGSSATERAQTALQWPKDERQARRSRAQGTSERAGGAAHTQIVGVDGAVERCQSRTSGPRPVFADENLSRSTGPPRPTVTVATA